MLEKIQMKIDSRNENLGETFEQRIILYFLWIIQPRSNNLEQNFDAARLNARHAHRTLQKCPLVLLRQMIMHPPQ